MTVASVVRHQDAFVLLGLVLRRACASWITDLHELSVDLSHVKLLRLAVVHRYQVVQLRRRLIQVEGQLLLLVILGLHVVRATSALVGAAGTTFGVH